MTETELRRRIVALELAVDRLTVELSELKARPQPTHPFGGAGGNYFPWGTMTTGTHVELSKMTGAIGTNVSRETPKGPNGADRNHWPFTPDPEQPRWVEQNGKLRFASPDNVSRETPKGPNGAGRPK